MLELAEVQRFCDALSELVGGQIADIKIEGPEKARIVGATVVAARRHGRRVIATLERGADEFVLVFYAHPASKLVSSRLLFDGGTELWIPDNYSMEIKDAWWNAVGICTAGRDLTEDGCDLAYVLSTAAKIIERSPSAISVQNFLLDERNVAGLGPYMVSEMLYAGDIIPSRELSDLTVLDMQRLLSFGKSFASLMVAFSGAEGVVQPRKESIMRVFGKEICPIGHNTKVIFGRKRMMGAVYFCPVCQA